MADDVGLWIGTYPVGLRPGYRAFVGAEQIWPVPAWMQWGATSIYGLLTGDVSKAVEPGAADHAGFSIGENILVGKVYFEGECCSGFDPDAGTTGIGLATYVGGEIPPHGIGSLDTELDMGSNSYRAALYSGFQQIGPDLTPQNTGQTYIYRFGFAYNADTRQCWVRQVYPGGPGPWILGGDPVAGTTPSYTMPGDDPVYAAGSVRGDSNAYMRIVANPKEWMNPGVEGYSPIDNTAHCIIGGGMGASANTGESGAGTYTMSNATPPVTWRMDGTLPPGITLSGPTRSGSYTSVGTYVAYITAKDAAGRVAQLRESVVVASGTFTLTGTLPGTATRGLLYTGTLTLGGLFSGTVTMDTSVGTIPAGLAWSISGNTVTLSGVPTATGTVNFTPRATDSSSTPKVAVGSAQTVIVAAATVVVGNGITTGTVGESASGSYTASGGAGPYTYSITDGTLPPAIAVNSEGVRSGTFTTEDTYDFTVHVVDAYGNTGDLAQHVVVQAVTITVGNPPSSPLRVGDAFSGTYTASGGVSPYTFITSAGTLPAGTAVSSSGVRSGTLTTRGGYTWTTRATDANAHIGELPQTITVMADITVSGGINSGTVGVAFTGAYASAGGEAPYTYTTTGSLPPGLSVATSGARSGTATTEGSYSFTVRSTDANGDYRDYPQTVVVAAAATGVNLRSHTQGSGTPTGTWSVAKPAGVAVGDLIVIAVGMNDTTAAGTPTGFSILTALTSTADGEVFSVFYRIADGSEGSTFSGTASTSSFADWSAQCFAFQGADPASPLSAFSTYNPNAFSGSPINFTLPSITTTVDGTLLLLLESIDVNARGAAAAVYTAPTDFTDIATEVSGGQVVTVYSASQMQDTSGATGEITNAATLAGGTNGSPMGVLLGVQARGPFKLEGELTPTAHTGLAYSSVMTLAGFYTGPVTMSEADGDLPPGLSWSVSGNDATLSGTPTDAGEYTFTPRATDSSGTPQVSDGPEQTITVVSGTVGIVQTKLNQKATGESNTILPDTPFTLGNKVLVVINRYSAPVTSVTVNGVAAIGLTQITNGSNNSAEVWMAEAGAGSAGVVIESSDGSSTKTVSIIERDDIDAPFSHLELTAPFPTDTFTGSVTTSAIEDKNMIVAVFVGENNQNVEITPPADGYTLIHNEPNGFAQAPGCAVYKDVTGESTASATFTTASDLSGSGVGMVSIKLI